jgi:hypothetical protein
MAITIVIIYQAMAMGAGMGAAADRIWGIRCGRDARDAHSIVGERRAAGMRGGAGGIRQEPLGPSKEGASSKEGRKEGDGRRAAQR